MICLSLLLIIVTICFIIFGLYIFNKIISYEKLKLIVTNFTNYEAILQYHMDKAYDIIYKHDIVIHSLDASQPPESEYSAILKKFLSLSFKLLGKRLTEELSYMYGSLESLSCVVSLYFYSKLESDEIRKISVDNLIGLESVDISKTMPNP